MAKSKQRYISTSFWDDAWIQECDPSEKLLYLYLMTNPLTNIAGVYKITMRRIVFDTGFNEETIRQILDRFEQAGKAYLHGEYMVIPSWPAHQRWKENGNTKKGIDMVVDNLPADMLKYLQSVHYRYPLEGPYTPCDPLEGPYTPCDPLEGPYTPLNNRDKDLDMDINPNLDKDKDKDAIAEPEPNPEPDIFPQSPEEDLRERITATLKAEYRNYVLDPEAEAALEDHRAALGEEAFWREFDDFWPTKRGKLNFFNTDFSKHLWKLRNGNGSRSGKPRGDPRPPGKCDNCGGTEFRQQGTVSKTIDYVQCFDCKRTWELQDSKWVITANGKKVPVF